MCGRERDKGCMIYVWDVAFCKGCVLCAEGEEPRAVCYVPGA